MLQPTQLIFNMKIEMLVGPLALQKRPVKESAYIEWY